MQTTKITPADLLLLSNPKNPGDHIRDLLKHLTIIYVLETGHYEVYTFAQAEDSDPNPIFRDTNTTATFDFISKYTNQSQTQFLDALVAFIRAQPHYINNSGEYHPLITKDQLNFSITDPDGDYEEINITIDLKP